MSIPARLETLKKLRKHPSKKKHPIKNTPSKNPTRGGANVYLFFGFTIIVIFLCPDASCWVSRVFVQFKLHAGVQGLGSGS